ncbi:Clr5 domain-containing protein [Triangularia verruculosa]|uniref:Clr5 domain-containing protein n=1 Tax=Triangularia verruculosa TaxID=2587418 RepID=A0AAN6X6V6_9PEZI|nr:Clr5 domain-containing protein [Triangularia verruculosa]
MPPPGHRRVDWEAHRSTFEDLYVVQDKPLPEVIEIMKRDFNVDATIKMYKKRIKAWGMFKNINGDEMLAMIRIKQHRHRQGKATRFYLRGKPVSDSKLRRFTNRHGVELNDDDLATDVQAPLRGITFCTPEPDDHPDTSSLNHDGALHPGPGISSADSTSVRCSMGSPNPEPRQLSPHENQSLSWDMPMSSSAGFVAQAANPFNPGQYFGSTLCTGSTAQQVHSWLDHGYFHRFDEYKYTGGNGSPHSANLDTGTDVGNAFTTQPFTHVEQLQLHHAVDRYPNTLDLLASPSHQVQLLSWDHSPLHHAPITSAAVNLPTTALQENLDLNPTAWDEITGLRHAGFQHCNGALVLGTEHESINYARYLDDGDGLTWAPAEAQDFDADGIR